MSVLYNMTRQPSSLWLPSPHSMIFFSSVTWNNSGEVHNVHKHQPLGHFILCLLDFSKTCQVWTEWSRLVVFCCCCSVSFRPWSWMGPQWVNASHPLNLRAQQCMQWTKTSRSLQFSKAVLMTRARLCTLLSMRTDRKLQYHQCPSQWIKRMRPLRSKWTQVTQHLCSAPSQALLPIRRIWLKDGTIQQWPLLKQHCQLGRHRDSPPMPHQRIQNQPLSLLWVMWLQEWQPRRSRPQRRAPQVELFTRINPKLLQHTNSQLRLMALLLQSSLAWFCSWCLWASYLSW